MLHLLTLKYICQIDICQAENAVWKQIEKFSLLPQRAEPYLNRVMLGYYY